MFEELTEKINALSTGLDITYKFDNGFVECQRRVIEILEEFKPQPQDKPNKPGWWWHKDTKEKLTPVFIEVMGNPINIGKRCLIIRSNEGITLISELKDKGKWYKAILPGVKNET